MKTLNPLCRMSSRLLLLGITAFLAASCGSYQNSSYYDNDGIYGGSDNQASRESGTSAKANSDNQYKNYFSALKLEEPEIFTDVDSYTSYSDSAQTSNREYSSGNSGWGGESENVTVNVYGNSWGYNYWNPYWYSPYWGYNSWYRPGWSFGIGWGSWYGPGLGWGYSSFYSPYYYSPYYWSNYYYDPYHYHGHGNHYVYHRGGRRAISYNSGLRNYNATRQSANTRSFTSDGTRNNPNFTNTRSSSTRSDVSPTRQSTYSPTRSNNSGVRQSSTPTRSYSPSSSGGGRSSGGFGGSRSGGGGGSRSGGGGRR